MRWSDAVGILAQEDASSIVLMCVVLIVLVLLGAAGVFWIRKRIWGTDDNASEDGFSLGDLRRLKKNGQITEEEYEKARAMIVAVTQRRAAEMGKAKPAPRIARQSPPRTDETDDDEPGSQPPG